MKFVITKDMEKVEFHDISFWKQYDEIEVEDTEGWVVNYVACETVYTFDYCQSTGRGDYCYDMRNVDHSKPANFTSDAKANAKMLHEIHPDCVKLELVKSK